MKDKIVYAITITLGILGIIYLVYAISIARAATRAGVTNTAEVGNNPCNRCLELCK